MVNSWAHTMPKLSSLLLFGLNTSHVDLILLSFRSSPFMVRQLHIIHWQGLIGILALDSIIQKTGITKRHLLRVTYMITFFIKIWRIWLSLLKVSWEYFIDIRLYFIKFHIYSITDIEYDPRCNRKKFGNKKN